MKLQAVIEGTNTVVSVGDTVTSFRGETATLLSLTRPRVPGKSGKVYVRWDETDFAAEYYDGVFDLEVMVKGF